MTPAEHDRIVKLENDRRRYMNNASRDRRRLEDNPNAVGPYSNVWEQAVRDCERELRSIGWASPSDKRRVVRILLGKET